MRGTRTRAILSALLLVAAACGRPASAVPGEADGDAREPAVAASLATDAAVTDQPLAVDPPPPAERWIPPECGPDEIEVPGGPGEGGELRPECTLTGRRAALERLRRRPPAERCPHDPHSLALPGPRPGQPMTTLELGLEWLAAGDPSAGHTDPRARETCVLVRDEPWVVVEPGAQLEIPADPLRAQAWFFAHTKTLVFAPPTQALRLVDAERGGPRLVARARAGVSTDPRVRPRPDRGGCPKGYYESASPAAEIPARCVPAAILAFSAAPGPAPKEDLAALLARLGEDPAALHEGALVVAARRPDERYWVPAGRVALWSEDDHHVALLVKPGERWYVWLDTSGSIHADVVADPAASQPDN
ncbi:MAG: hypothetical protein KC486_03775 [Myxococcales bacterium]|nr:hypothetical protein [Myxococcales bacterium]